MRRHHFVRPGGPLGAYADDYRIYLVQAGYSFGGLQHRLSQFGELSRWLEAEGLGTVDLGEEQAARFACSRRVRGLKTSTSPASFRLPLKFLRSIAVIPPVAAHQGPFEELFEDYRRYLISERGLAERTVSAHLGAAREFCVRVAQGPEDLAGLSALTVRAYVLGAKDRVSPSSLVQTIGALRSLLRYLHLSGLSANLVPVVPKLAGHRAAPQPPGLSSAQLDRLLSACDLRRGVGRRDFAILMLLSRLGLRGGEVTRIDLGDIDWRHGELIVRGKGDRHERLPLPVEVGEAVAGYLRRGRPAGPPEQRAVFLTARPPWRRLELSGVQTVVRHASVRAGLGALGPRCLRHSAASRMHLAGLSLLTVAQVLRHHDTRMTTLYVDVDPAVMVGLARPWPKGGQS